MVLAYSYGILHENPVRLATPALIASNLGASAATVRRHIREDGTPRCDSEGWDDEAGSYVYVSDYLKGRAGNDDFATSAQRRKALRRARLLPRAQENF